MRRTGGVTRSSTSGHLELQKGYTSSSLVWSPQLLMLATPMGDLVLMLLITLLPLGMLAVYVELMALFAELHQASP